MTVKDKMYIVEKLTIIIYVFFKFSPKSLFAIKYNWRVQNKAKEHDLIVRSSFQSQKIPTPMMNNV